MRFKLNSLTTLFLLTATLFACKQEVKTTQQTAKSDKLPNIILIFADDMGYGDLSCYGQKNYQTPHLDQMAKEGIRLTNFYVAQPVCSASRASLLTGCYSNRVGVSGAFFPTDSIGLNQNETTLAEIVKQKDYATAIFGKWHLGHLPEFLPTKHGFDEYFGVPYSNDMWSKHPNNANFKFGPLPIVEGEETVKYLEENQDSLTTWYTQRTINFIDKNKDKPFFIYLAHSMPHVPLYVSDKFRGKSGTGLYGDVIMEIDWSVGEINKALKEKGLDENTLVIFTSDNGPWLSYGTHSGVTGPLREGKGTVWEGGIRVPFIAKWPAKIPSGVEQDIPAATIDILPTITNWIDATMPEKPIDGKDIEPILLAKEEAENPHDAYFFYYKQNELESMLSGDGKWKLYFPHTYRSIEGRQGRDDGLPIPYNFQVKAGLELYDLNNDISETTDVIESNTKTAEKLKILADSMRTELGDNLNKVEGKGNREIGKFGESMN
ncbi:sulfatase family protein [Chondrinema litorale]|uniref:sulfatase family protein n=1 Tax=Chondrinema litorale TaxID=2994555 RepID=UPI002543AFB9|nr:sulfatase [Chondrinema litorale]UZR98078.1 sulfatase [Chondrinema litorale]